MRKRGITFILWANAFHKINEYNNIKTVHSCMYKVLNVNFTYQTEHLPYLNVNGGKIDWKTAVKFANVDPFLKFKKNGKRYFSLIVMKIFGAVQFIEL